MLNNKQVKFLKKEAHTLKPIFQIGKNGLNDDMLTQIREALNKRELIKINLLQNTMEDEDHVGEVLENTIGVDVVQIIGHTLVVYKPSQKEKYQTLSNVVKTLR